MQIIQIIYLPPYPVNSLFSETLAEILRVMTYYAHRDITTTKRRKWCKSHCEPVQQRLLSVRAMGLRCGCSSVIVSMHNYKFWQANWMRMLRSESHLMSELHVGVDSSHGVSKLPAHSLNCTIIKSDVCFSSFSKANCILQNYLDHWILETKVHFSVMNESGYIFQNNKI